MDASMKRKIIEFISYHLMKLFFKSYDVKCHLLKSLISGAKEYMYITATIFILNTPSADAELLNRIIWIEHEINIDVV